MKVTLLIDDVRNMQTDVTARSAEVAKVVMNSPHLKFDVVYLDHDLGPGDNGLDVLRWMFKNKIRPSKVVLVTMNPVGRRNLECELSDNGYTKSGNGWVS